MSHPWEITNKTSLVISVHMMGVFGSPFAYSPCLILEARRLLSTWQRGWKLPMRHETFGLSIVGQTMYQPSLSILNRLNRWHDQQPLTITNHYQPSAIINHH